MTTCSRNCHHIENHTFDPNPCGPCGPQAYYGTDNHSQFFDVSHTKASVAMPGVMSGLYNPCGPLNLCCSCGTASILTGVTTTANMYLELEFSYTNSCLNKKIKIEKDGIYTIDYLEDGTIKRCSGKISDIYKVYTVDDKDNIYKITVDCSANYTNNVVVMKTDQIRNISVYTPYADEDTTILNSLHRYGTTIGMVKNAIVTNATVDKNGNILEGTIIEGIVEGYTHDGIATGENNNKHTITTINARTYGGHITGGMILNGIVRSGDVDGIVEEGTNITEKATVKGIISNCVIVNTIIEGGKTDQGTIIDPTLQNSIVIDGTITGDIVTTGGITAGDITTGGITTGGTVVGGTATGTIDDNRYTIEGGVTTGDNLVTTGGVVVGGTIIGGTQIGSVIVGAVIKGGTCTGGTTTGGTTTGGTIIPSKTFETPIAKPSRNPDYNKVNAAEKTPTDLLNMKKKNIDDLLVWVKHDTAEVGSNLGTARIQGVEGQIYED